MPDTLDERIQRLNKEYIDAVNREQSLRDLAFLSDYDVIADVKVHALTPILHNILTLNNSPLLCGGTITPESLLVFLWTVKVKEQGETQELFFQSTIKEISDVTLCEEIVEYIKRSFQDGLGGGSDVETLPYWSHLASLVDIFAHEYGWTESTILNMPYRRMLQYVRVIVKRSDPKKILFNSTDEYKKKIAEEIIKG